MKLLKITTGYVVQVYNKETGKFESQCFIAGDEVSIETETGQPVSETIDEYLPFYMVQPEN